MKPTRSGTQNSKAPSVTLVSRSTTRSASPSKWNSKSNPVGPCLSRGRYQFI